MNKKAAFVSVMNGLKKRFDALSALPLDTLDAIGLREIHKTL